MEAIASARLSSLDAAFLALETPDAHMHVGWKGLFDPRADGTAVTLPALRDSVAARVAAVPRFRQRLAAPPGGLAEPRWIDDTAFDVREHVVALSGPDEVLPREHFDELADLVLSEPLDRRRPLWRIHLAPRLDDGTTGLVMKVHHAMVDGISAVELALVLLDLDPEARHPSPGPWQAESAPGAARLTVDALADLGGETLRAAGGLARLAADPMRGVRMAGTLRRAALRASEDALRPAPRSWVNTTIGPRRRLVGLSVPIESLLAIKRRHGLTLNEVALAAVSGGLRQYALQRRIMPRPLKTMVPVSVRSEDEAAALGNRISFVFVDLPLHLRHPADRLEAVRQASAAFKDGGQATGGEAVLGLLAFMPSPLRTRAARLAAAPRTYNLVVSNVPGPRVPVYLLGARLREAFPVVPITEGHALSVGMFSHHEQFSFGLYADPSALPEVDRLPLALNAAVLELSRSRPRRTRAAA